MQDTCLIPNWPAPSNIRAFTTTLLTDQTQILSHLPQQPVWLNQTHGVNVVVADKVVPGKPEPEADASVAFELNTVCIIRTADCLPILICDRDGTQVAALHAGWRSLAAGIISETLQQFTAPMQQCLVWLGPAIGPQAFEVGADVLAGFAAHNWSNTAIQSAFTLKPNTPDKWLGNLYHLSRIALQQEGILADNIYGGEWCTYSDPARFYSYRRSKDTGRMLSLIWREA